MRYQVIAYGYGDLWRVHECRSRAYARHEKRFQQRLQEVKVIFRIANYPLESGQFITFIEYRKQYPIVKIWDRKKPGWIL